MKMTNSPAFPVSLKLKKPTDYYAVDLLSNSGLTQFNAKIYDLPGMTASPATLRKGQLLHHACYEEDVFQATPEAKMFVDGRGVTADELKANDDMIRHVLALSKVAKNTPMLQYFLKHKAAQFEKDFYCLINGVPFKVKPDAMIQEKSGYINDLKSTACKTREDFIDACTNYNYWRQAWLYLTGTGCKHFSFLGVSKSAVGKTFLVDVKNHKKEMKEAGEEALELIAMYCKLHPNYISKSLKLFVTNGR